MITKKHHWKITEQFVTEDEKGKKLDVWEYTFVIESRRGQQRTTIARGGKKYKTPEGEIVELQEDGSFILKNETYRRVKNEK